MDTFLFAPQRYEKLYNCSFYKVDDRTLEDRRHIAIGLLYILTSVFLLALYTPCILIFAKKEYIKQSCYKLMLYIGITDYLILLFNGVLTGFLGIFGVVYCQYPRAMYITGGLGFSMWCCQSIATLILAINRCLEMWNQQLTMKYFEGSKTFLWLLIPTIYFFCVWFFSMPAAFIPFVMAWLFDPHAGYFDDDKNVYINKVHAPNNIFLAIAIPSLYGIFMISFRRKFKVSSLSSAQQCKTQKQVKQTFLQVFVISLFTFFICISYLIIQVIPLPAELVFITQYCWILYSGFPAIIYLTMNQTIRKGVKRMLLPNGWNPSKDRSGSIAHLDVKTTTGSGHKYGKSVVSPVKDDMVSTFH